MARFFQHHLLNPALREGQRVGWVGHKQSPNSSGNLSGGIWCILLFLMTYLWQVAGAFHLFLKYLSSICKASGTRLDPEDAMWAKLTRSHPRGDGMLASTARTPPRGHHAAAADLELLHDQCDEGQLM